MPQPLHLGWTRARGWLLAASVLVTLTFALAASAQTPPDYGLKQTAQAAGLPTGQPSLPAVTAAVVNTILSVIGVLAIVVILYGGFLWMTSAGNQEKISQAKRLLASAVVGLAIIFAAYVVAYFITSSLSKATGTTPPAASGGSTPSGTGYYVGQQCGQNNGFCAPACAQSTFQIGTFDCTQGEVCCSQ